MVGISNGREEKDSQSCVLVGNYDNGDFRRAWVVTF
jgi:hypothetical protein